MLRTARTLILITLLYNLIEGVIAIGAGLRAGSISLVAFGADSYLEVAAASVVLWRLSISDPERGERMEARAVRFIGATFLLLAAAIFFQSVTAFTSRNAADESLIGIALALASVTVMPGISLWKLRVAAKGSILALAQEAKETLACSYLSLTLLLGLSANALLGWWWLDAATALLLTPWLVREGVEGLRGEHCGDACNLCSCRACLFGLRACAQPCCVTA